MSRIIVYVEGKSDVLAMRTLLASLIAARQNEGISIEFFEPSDGDRKESLMRKMPLRALRILQNDPNSIVVIMPDLHPVDKVAPHRTCENLQADIQNEFQQVLRRQHATVTQYTHRFKVFCFKYELEALILAAEEELARHLKIGKLPIIWKIPVEDQNDNHPPKEVVENLFQSHGRKYREVIDAPQILEKAGYQKIADACPQCFKPFITFLETAFSGNDA